jgi:hypothetical protein
MTRFATYKKCAALAIVAAAITTAGWSVGAGIAQADTKHPVPHPSPNLSIVRHNPFNFDQRFEGRPIDRFFDRFFNDDSLQRR